MKREFIVREDGLLCLDGYPLAIRRVPAGHNGSRFTRFDLLENGNVYGETHTLTEARRRINETADDIDVFTPA